MGALKFNPQTGGVTWSNPVAAPVVEVITLTNEHLNAKRVQLKSTPVSPSFVMVYPQGGIMQMNGVDFEIEGQFLSWENLGLDNFLETNEVLTIQYSA